MLDFCVLNGGFGASRFPWRLGPCYSFFYCSYRTSPACAADLFSVHRLRSRRLLNSMSTRHEDERSQSKTFQPSQCWKLHDPKVVTNLFYNIFGFLLQRRIYLKSAKATPVQESNWFAKRTWMFFFLCRLSMQLFFDVFSCLWCFFVFWAYFEVDGLEWFSCVIWR